MKYKILLAIADGLGDRPIEELNKKTPLTFATTPTLDAIAKEGVNGIMDLYQVGVPVGTDLGHMILFGYDAKDYPGRGPIEAFGDGLDLHAGDIAFRCNFATVNQNMEVIDRRAGRIRMGTSELAQAIDGLEIDGIQVIFKPATEHRAVLILRGKGLSPNITDTDPKKESLKIKECVAKDNSKEAHFTANLLNKVLQKVHEILEQHPLNASRTQKGLLPANAILTRGAGQMPQLSKITEQYGIKASVVASEKTVLGVARMAGFDIISDQSFTGNVDTNYQLKAQKAIEALAENDIVVLHFKATDLMGHDNNPNGKVKAIEQYDEMLSIVKTYANEHPEVILALAADHSTPCERKEHSGEPVPVTICGKPIRKDGVVAYNEITCSQGGLGRIKGNDFNHILLDYLEVVSKMGN